MALGYCLVCQKLVAILAGERLHPGTMRRAWWPVEHEAPNGGPCLGSKKPIR